MTASKKTGQAANTALWDAAAPNEFDLPAMLREQYRICSCLKYSEEQQVFLLEGEGAKWRCLLKTAIGEAAEVLREEYEYLHTYHKAPFLPSVITCFPEGERWYLLREYIEGETLHQIVESDGPMPAGQSVEAAGAVCDMLVWLHRQVPPVIHRDIKPQNIVRTPAGEYRLIDLGSARIYLPGKPHDTVLMGTQATAAPEQFGFQQTDVRTDVYAIGKLLVFLLTGDYNSEGERLNELPAPLRRVASRCLAFDPNDRYSTAIALRNALQGKHARRFLLCGALITIMLACIATVIVFMPKLLDTAHGFKAVQFISPLIEQAVREELGVEPGDDIYPQDLAAVTELIIRGDQVMHEWDEPNHAPHLYASNRDAGRYELASLEDLRLLPNLNTLALNNQQVSDLSPLSELPLYRLCLCGQQIKDLTPLQSCTSLEVLHLGGNPVVWIEPLSALTHLLDLDICDTKVRDLSPLRNLPLERLLIQALPTYRTLPTLRGLPLQVLDISFLPADLLEDVATMTDLWFFSIFYTENIDFSTLKPLTGLTYLNICYGSVSNWDGLESLTRVKTFRMREVVADDLEPLRMLPNLEALDLYDAVVGDLSALKSMPALKKVCADADLAERIRGEIPSPTFLIVDDLYN